VKTIKLWILLTPVWFSFGCPGHVISKRVEMSRDHTYITFVKTQKPYVFEGEVGGEQLSLTKLLAFANERYRIDVSPKSENLNLYASGQGISVEESGERGLTKTVTIDDSPETIVEIVLSAHPDSATYTLTVTKLGPITP